MADSVSVASMWSRDDGKGPIAKGQLRLRDVKWAYDNTQNDALRVVLRAIGTALRESGFTDKNGDPALDLAVWRNNRKQKDNDPDYRLSIGEPWKPAPRADDGGGDWGTPDTDQEVPF